MLLKTFSMILKLSDAPRAPRTRSAPGARECFGKRIVHCRLDCRPHDRRYIRYRVERHRSRRRISWRRPRR